jgi:phage terminase large subunit-like protein
MLEKLFVNRKYVISIADPKKLDKVARMIRVQPEFAAGMIWAPDKSWANMVIDECAVAPRGRYDDLVDSTTQALYYLRSQGFLERREEQFVRNQNAGMQYKQVPPLYQV